LDLVTPDWRGTGDTPLGKQPLSTRLLARDVVAVLDDLGLDRVDIYATSMGGRVAQWLATDHPDRVRRLLLGCTSPGARMGRERSQAVRRRLADPDPVRRTEALIDLMYTPARRAEHPGPYGALGDSTASPRAFQQHLRASNAHDTYDVLDKITAPTLVLHGTDDELSPVENAEILADRIPNSRAVIFPGARRTDTIPPRCRRRARERHASGPHAPAAPCRHASHRTRSCVAGPSSHCETSNTSSCPSRRRCCLHTDRRTHPTSRSSRP
jgi:pimeloyl-ACP methyl ester carboxylesterase